MKRISKEELAKRLAHAVGLEDGKEGLGILIYGWFHYRRYGRKTFKAYLWQVCGDEYDAQH